MAIHHDKTAYGKLASAREDLSEERVLEMLRLLSETSEEAEETEKRNVGTIEKTDRESIDQFAEKRDREPDRPTHRKGKPYSHKSARRACAVGRKRRGEARFRWSARARRSAPFRAVRAGRPRFFPHRRLTSVEKAAFPYLPYFPHSPYLPCRRIESQDPQNGSWYNPLIRKEGEGWIG